MFVFRKENTFTTKVRIFDPTDGGRKVGKEIEVDFRVMSPEFVTEQASLALRARQAGDYTDDAALLLEQTVAGWRGIKVDDRDGEDLLFSDENLRALISIPYVRSALVEAYFEGVNGKARKGN